MRGLFAYKLLAYKNIKCSKSIPGSPTVDWQMWKNFFNVNIFFKCKHVRIKDYSLKYVGVVCCLKVRLYCLTFSAFSNLN